mmetsp:Transcript_33491/g.30469  ORF Transcript_33491/g.30469 Transcript_33491/m.30469 type:complete len:155 (-) Transcript_33491:4-468(-)
MSSASLGNLRIKDVDRMMKNKKEIIDANARKVKARHFTMNSMVTIRKKDNEEDRIRKEKAWNDKYELRFEKNKKALQKVQEGVAYKIYLNQQSASASHQKLKENKAKMDEEFFYKKLNAQIRRTVKERIAQEKVEEKIKTTIMNAKRADNFRNR